MARNPVVYILPATIDVPIGITTDLSRRLEEHHQGMVHHTARYNIHRLHLLQVTRDSTDAIARESS